MVNLFVERDILLYLPANDHIIVNNDVDDLCTQACDACHLDAVSLFIFQLQVVGHLECEDSKEATESYPGKEYDGENKSRNFVALMVHQII